RGVEELFPPQAEAVRRGLLDLERNFVVAVPTAGGKTLIAELLMLRSLLERGGKCMYIVPLKALASEKLEEFRRYESLGLRVGIATGDYDASDEWLAPYDIIVTTSEKADSLIRHRSPWLEEVNLLVVDEVHLIHDPSRGPTLEVTLARLRRLCGRLLILALSATISNADEIARWLNAELVSSDWRPVELREGVCYAGEILFTDSSRRRVESSYANEALNLALDTVKEGGQSLVFVNTRRGAERFATEAAPKLRRLLSTAERERLSELAERVLHVLAEPTRICRRLSKAITGGAAFHHAGLAPEQRSLVERAFRENLLKVLSATPTLAAGVNLPARRVVIRDYRRYDSSLGYMEIPVMEVKQMAGRAGRPRYDSYGEAILIARSEEERDFLLERYLLAEPERVYSKLAALPALRTHVLASVATGDAGSFEELQQFFSNTFYGYQQEAYTLESSLLSVLDFLEREGFLEVEGERLAATPFGKRVSELYIDPLSAVTLRRALERADAVETTPLSYLHAISRCSELSTLYLRKGEYEEYLPRLLELESQLLFPVPSPYAEPHAFEHCLAELKTALFLQDWIEERSEEYLLERYNLAPGDIHSRVEIAEWLLYAMEEIGRLFSFGKREELARLRLRVKHGIREELLELVSLRGIGRARARRLFSRGFRTLEALRRASLGELAAVPGIGERLASSIKAQLGGETEPREKPRSTRQSTLTRF
ncbi:MAG: ATP-dependent DNA helicase, partial [Euryarchaeota archaeon]|nr:ATP-dependent DNA helicase [Euryarchaeota archaeon]